MKKIIIILLISSLSILNGCSSEDKSSNNFVPKKECYEPKNPYSSGSGHDAGFKWAEKNNPNSCSGNSDSFIDGCNEYLNQLRKYKNCLND